MTDPAPNCPVLSESSRGTLMTADRVLDGHYEIGDAIGWGGMANVYLGRDTRSGRFVAIKVLRKDLAQDPLFQSRFRREAKVLAGLRHPAIVSIYDTGYEEVAASSGNPVCVPFIVMEYVAGQSLRDVLKLGRPKLKESIQYQVGILSALEFSHRAGIVHRDIKPANVMITTEGTVKVVDFGIARASGDSAETITQTHEVLGTPKYLAPEQVRGETADARSDLYSAGCLFYELLTGRPPFVGVDPLSVAYQHVYEQPARVSSWSLGLTPGFDSILVKALAKNRKDRFQNARVFREALQSAAKGIIHDDDLADRRTAAATTDRGRVPAGAKASAVRAAAIRSAATCRERQDLSGGLVESPRKFGVRVATTIRPTSGQESS